MNQEQDELTAKFLLGKLSEEEQTKIETDYFSNHASFENILIAENDLIDAYVTGRLSVEDRRLFENRLLLNPQQRQRVEFARTLNQYTASQPFGLIEAKSQSTVSKWSAIISQLFSPKPLMAFSFAAIVLLLIGGIWLSINNNSKEMAHVEQTIEETTDQTPSQLPDTRSDEKSELTINKIINAHSKEPDTSLSHPSLKTTKPQALPKKSSESSTGPTRIISTVILSLGTTRDTGTTKIINIPRKTDFVNLQLPFEEAEFDSYSTILETVEGQKIWSSGAIKPAKRKSQSTLIVTVPANRLKKGDYIISLKGLTDKGVYESVGDYSFTVERK